MNLIFIPFCSFQCVLSVQYFQLILSSVMCFADSGMWCSRSHQLMWANLKSLVDS